MSLYSSFRDIFSNLGSCLLLTTHAVTTNRLSAGAMWGHGVTEWGQEKCEWGDQGTIASIARDVAGARAGPSQGMVRVTGARAGEAEARRRGGDCQLLPAHTSMAGPRPHWRQCQHPSNDPTQRTSIRHNNVIREYEVSQGIIALKILHFYVECHIIENRDIIEDIIKEILCASSSWPTSEYLSYDKL